MSRLLRMSKTLLLALVLALASSAAFAQGYGRLDYFEGMLRVNAAGQGQWVPASPGLPVVAGDGLLSDPGSRAVLSLGVARVDMDEATALRIVRLDPADVDLSLDQGRVIVTARGLPPGGIRVDTAAGRFDLLTPGIFRAAVLGPGGFTFAALQGQARLVGNRAAIVISSGQEAVIGADQASLSLTSAGLTPLDGWSRSLAAPPDVMVAPPVYATRPWVAAPREEFVPIPAPIIIEPSRRHEEGRAEERHAEPERHDWRDNHEQHAPPAAVAPQMQVRTAPAIPAHPVAAPPSAAAPGASPATSQAARPAKPAHPGEGQHPGEPQHGEPGR